MAAHAKNCPCCGEPIEPGARVHFTVNREYIARRFQTDTVGTVCTKFYLCVDCATSTLEDIGLELPDVGR